MRAVFVGAGSLSVMTVRLLLERGHEAVLIEKNKQRIDALSDELDCGFLHGDGSKPAVLREADPSATAILFCLTGDDQTNILSSLAGRSVGYERVVTKLDDPEFEHLSLELGLEDLIIPSRTIGRYLADMFEGRDHMELLATVKGDARIFSFVARKEEEKAIGELQLPQKSRVMFLYRDDKFTLPEPQMQLREEDEVVLITHRDHLEELEQRWGNSTQRGSRR